MKESLYFRVAACSVLLSTSSLAAGDPASGSDQGPVPIGSPGDWVTPADYPLISRMNARSGITAFKLSIDEKGVPSACEILASSADAALDKATCELLSARARFTPVRDSTGKPVASTYTNRIRWVLPDSPTDVGDGTRTMTIEADVSSSGVIERCRLVQKDELIFKNAPDPCPQWLGTQALKPLPNQQMPRVKLRIKNSLEFIEVEQ